jgi:hypothetical protein
MSKTVTIALFTLRIAGVGALLLGLAVWSGHLLGLRPVHMALGLALVVALSTLSLYGLAQRYLRWRAALLFIVALAVIGLGVTQTDLLPGSEHWVIRVVHLLLGLGAMGLGEALAKRLRVSAQQPARQGQAADQLARAGQR